MFNPQNQSLTVLKGSTVNPVHVPKFSDSDRKKRDRQLAKYTEVKDGQRIVKEDVCFDTHLVELPCSVLEVQQMAGKSGKMQRDVS